MESLELRERRVLSAVFCVRFLLEQRLSRIYKNHLEWSQSEAEDVPQEHLRTLHKIVQTRSPLLVSNFG